MAVVEKWVQFPPPGHRADVWGFGDLLCLNGQRGAILVQTSTLANAGVRREKIAKSLEAKLWKDCGNSILGIWWRKVKNPTTKRVMWMPKVEEL